MEEAFPFITSCWVTKKKKKELGGINMWVWGEVADRSPRKMTREEIRCANEEGTSKMRTSGSSAGTTRGAEHRAPPDYISSAHDHFRGRIRNEKSRSRTRKRRRATEEEEIPEKRQPRQCSPEYKKEIRRNISLLLEKCRLIGKKRNHSKKKNSMLGGKKCGHELKPSQGGSRSKRIS